MNIFKACSKNQQGFVIDKILHEFVPVLNKWLPKQRFPPVQLTNLWDDFIPSSFKMSKLGLAGC